MIGNCLKNSNSGKLIVFFHFSLFIFLGAEDKQKNLGVCSRIILLAKLKCSARGKGVNGIGITLLMVGTCESI